MNSIFKYGIISGLLLVGLTWAGELIFGLEPENFEIQEVYGYATMVLGLSVIFFGVRRYRDELEGGTISFGKALKIGGQFGCFLEEISKARARLELFAHVLDWPAHFVGAGEGAFTDRVIR